MSLASAGVIKTEDSNYCVQSHYSLLKLKMGDCNSPYYFSKKFYWDGNETIRSGGVAYKNSNNRCWDYNTDIDNDDYTALTMKDCDDTKTNQQACMAYACAWQLRDDMHAKACACTYTFMRLSYTCTVLLGRGPAQITVRRPVRHQ